MPTTMQIRPLSFRARAQTAPVVVAHKSSLLDVKRWDVYQPATPWDSLRRDAELWSQSGDCTVHLYAKGQSQRGPSFRVSYRSLHNAHCVDALQTASSQPCFSSQTSPLNSNSTTPVTSPLASSPASHELYLAAPTHLNREDAYRFNLTTRNFFAWVRGKPLVGESLGWALVALAERIHQWSSADIDVIQEVLYYAERIGYMDFVDSPQNSLAMLHFAEHFQDRSLWIDSFAHCVGMKEMLADNYGYELISRKSKALMSRAYLEMDLHIGRATSSIATFLEEELSSAHLGLVLGARNHLDTFRTFVQTFCVAKYGYWPPQQHGVYDRDLYASMLEDFTALYSYLADTSKSNARTQYGANGGICVVQNLEAFNTRQRLPPLPYSLPLIPQLGESNRGSQLSRSLLHLRSNSKDGKLERIMTARHGLENATNRDDPHVMSSGFVQAYINFEGDLAVRCDDKVSTIEARKVRWLLAYGMLQVLTSMNQTPPEVRHSENAPYALCCLTEGCPSWNSTPLADLTPTRTTSLQLPAFNRAMTTQLSPLTTIQPDCEFADYFAYKPSVSARAPSPPPRKSPMRRLSTLRRASVRLSKRGGRPLSLHNHTADALTRVQSTMTPDSPVSVAGSSKCSKSPAPSLSWSAEGAESSSTEDESGSFDFDEASFANLGDNDFDLAAMIAKAQNHAPDLKSHPAFNTVDAFLDDFLLSAF